MSNYNIPQLPLPYDLETKGVLKQLNKANKKLAELKGIATTIPNENILISTLTLQEAKDSSEVENIVTTQDDLYKASVSLNDGFFSPYLWIAQRILTTPVPSKQFQNNGFIPKMSVSGTNSAGYVPENTILGTHYQRNLPQNEYLDHIDGCFKGNQGEIIIKV